MQQVSTEGVPGETRLGQQGDPLRNVQEISIRPYNKSYMHNPAPVLENNSYKLLWDFNIQTDHLIPARRPDLKIISKKKKKRICKIVDFAVSADHGINLKEREKKDKYLDLAREKTLEHESGNAKNGQNPETSLGDFRRLAVTQTPVKNHQLTLM